MGKLTTPIQVCDMCGYREMPEEPWAFVIRVACTPNGWRVFEVCRMCHDRVLRFCESGGKDGGK